MITQFNEYRNNLVQPDNQIEQDHIISEYLATFEPKMVILENYWTEELFSNTLSVMPFLSNIGNILENDRIIRVAHRYFDSAESLSYYVKQPNGIIWKDEDVYGAIVYYVAAHGLEAGLDATLGKITKDQLIDTFRGLGELYPNLLYFGSCSIFGGSKGKEFGEELLAATGCKAILGYQSQKVGFLHSIITDLLFLSRFLGYTADDPFKILPDLYNSVLTDFPPSIELGFTMFYSGV